MTPPPPAAFRPVWGRKRYEDHTKDELYEKAKMRGIEGRSTMDKDELIEALREH